MMSLQVHVIILFDLILSAQQDWSTYRVSKTVIGPKSSLNSEWPPGELNTSFLLDYPSSNLDI